MDQPIGVRTLGPRREGENACGETTFAVSADQVLTPIVCIAGLAPLDPGLAIRVEPDRAGRESVRDASCLGIRHRNGPP
jgi:hypothetical protein